jgi:hypothetical protein
VDLATEFPIDFWGEGLGEFIAKTGLQPYCGSAGGSGMEVIYVIPRHWGGNSNKAKKNPSLWGS